MSKLCLYFSDDVHCSLDVPDEYAIMFFNCLEDNLFNYLTRVNDQDSAGHFMMSLHQYKHMLKGSAAFDFLPPRCIEDVKNDIALDYPIIE